MHPGGPAATKAPGHVTSRKEARHPFLQKVDHDVDVRRSKRFAKAFDQLRMHHHRLDERDGTDRCGRLSDRSSESCNGKLVVRGHLGSPPTEVDIQEYVVLGRVELVPRRNFDEPRGDPERGRARAV